MHLDVNIVAICADCDRRRGTVSRPSLLGVNTKNYGAAPLACHGGRFGRAPAHVDTWQRGQRQQHLAAVLRQPGR